MFSPEEARMMGQLGGCDVQAWRAAQVPGRRAWGCWSRGQSMYGGLRACVGLGGGHGLQGIASGDKY